MKRAKEATGDRRQRTSVTVARGRTSEPRLPHERDESADSQVQGNTQSEEIGRKALEDIRAGRVDTDRGPVLEELFRTKLQQDDAAERPTKPKRRR